MQTELVAAIAQLGGLRDGQAGSVVGPTSPASLPLPLRVAA
ncbi:hypothetical protein [Nostoc sp. UIC 10630]|nr:hypothetical protein [Nostoc sp. UIC 10630]